MYESLKRFVNYVASQRYDQPVAVYTDIVMGDWVAWLETIDGQRLWHIKGDDERLLLERMLAYLTSKLITVEEAAAILNVNRARVTALLAAGRMPPAIKIGEIWAIPKAFVEDFKRVGRLPPVRPRTPGDAHLTMHLSRQKMRTNVPA